MRIRTFGAFAVLRLPWFGCDPQFTAGMHIAKSYTNRVRKACCWCSALRLRPRSTYNQQKSPARQNQIRLIGRPRGSLHTPQRSPWRQRPHRSAHVPFRGTQPAQFPACLWEHSPQTSHVAKRLLPQRGAGLTRDLQLRIRLCLSVPFRRTPTPRARQTAATAYCRVAVRVARVPDNHAAIPTGLRLHPIRLSPAVAARLVWRRANCPDCFGRSEATGRTKAVFKETVAQFGGSQARSCCCEKELHE